MISKWVDIFKYNKRKPLAAENCADREGQRIRYVYITVGVGG